MGCEEGIRRTGSRSRREVLDLFVERLEDYKASAVRIGGDLPGAIAGALARRGITTLAVPHDLPEAWLAGVEGRIRGPDASAEIPLSEAGRGRAKDPAADPAHPAKDPAEPAHPVEILRDGPGHPIAHARLAEVQGALTGCALAVAETGTIILDSGPGQGRRALTLLPDYHLCVVFAGQVVEGVPEAVELMGRTVRESRAPLTLISGPSATSDIELSRVEGVHGPRTLEVILVEAQP